MGCVLVYIVISYDIEDDRRRTKVMKTLKNFGQWVQYSVFECDLTKEQYLKLSRRLEKLIDSRRDSIRYYFLCEKCAGKILRVGGVSPRDDSMFFV